MQTTDLGAKEPLTPLTGNRSHEPNVAPYGPEDKHVYDSSTERAFWSHWTIIFIKITHNS